EDCKEQLEKLQYEEHQGERAIENIKPAYRKFLAGIYCVEQFPNLGIDLINESLTSEPRMLKPEHALACLTDVYVRHNAYNEAQKVLKLLSEYYPNSVWLK
ncbi:MAG: hypothetical protein IKP71_05685, partial [Candidatus Riflebacteria bacterium]|nr:hypothetical protein [Candidatus Riflebacteria bacterium]